MKCFYCFNTAIFSIDRSCACNYAMELNRHSLIYIGRGLRNEVARRGQHLQQCATPKVQRVFCTAKRQTHQQPSSYAVIYFLTCLFGQFWGWRKSFFRTKRSVTQSRRRWRKDRPHRIGMTRWGLERWHDNIIITQNCGIFCVCVHTHPQNPHCWLLCYAAKYLKSPA